MKSSIVLADDHAMFRQGLRSMLEGEPGMAVVGEAETGHEAFAQVAETSANTVIMDLFMPRLNGIDASRSLIKKYPQLKIIILSAHESAQQVRDVFQAGASAYVLKAAALNELMEALRTVRNGGTFLSGAITNVVVDQYLRNDSHDGANSPYHSLTPREREVLQLVADGFSTREIAARLSVSTKTVETHRQASMKKLDLRSVVHLTKYAVQQGLTTLNY